ncbi:MAG: carboxypeptidase regulatory-like domain-containing protein, partial [bacterium]
IKTLSLEGLQQVNQDLTLFPEDGFISGTVWDVQDSSGISGVTITATFSEDPEKFYFDTTDASGRYTLSNLPVVPAATYTVGAFKNGYVLQQDAFSNVVVNTDRLDFYLVQPNQIIAGTVLDKDTREALDRVKVERSGSTDEVFTNKSGRFVLTSLLPNQIYDIRVSKSGFFPDTLRNVAAGDTTVVIEMSRRYAFVTGRVTDTSGVAMQDVEIQAIPEQNGREGSAFTNTSGNYRLLLIAGDYEIRPVKINHRNLPNSRHVSLVEDSTETGVDFILEPQTLQFINISGTSEISNRDPITCFEANPQDLKGDNIENFGKLNWSLNVSDRAATIDDLGCLEVNPNYFGELTITATDPASGISGNLDVDVFAPIDSTTETVLFDDRGLQLVINKGSIPLSENLLVSKKPVAPAKKGRAEIIISDSSYVLKPPGLQINGEFGEQSQVGPGLDLISVNSTVKLSLPAPPNTAGQRRFIAKWDEKKSEWLLFATSEKENNILETKIFDVGEYVALAISKPLAIENLTLLPNPFSPFQEIDGRSGLKIAFDISSGAAPNPLLTLKIYNLEGNLVRNLHDQTPFPRGHSSVYWDGKTDNGTYARNGRYLVQFILEDPAEKESEMKTVVLIK